MAPPEPVPTWVLGATGYVAGELLRWLDGHPHLALHAALSRSRAGEPLGAVFPKLTRALRAHRFEPPSRLESLGAGPAAVFSCLPHGEAAAVVAGIVGREGVRVVDLSADFRHRDRATWEAVYGEAHAAPASLDAFVCDLPELHPEPVPGAVAHPGCFTTAVTLGAAPLAAAGRLADGLFVTAVTGSTGSGARPSAGTHHPERHGNLWAYKALAHRHRPEMEALLGRVAGAPVPVAFVPCSGPFARGIHATIQVRLASPVAADELVADYRAFYDGRPFVEVIDELPRLADVTGTNRCRIGLAVSGRDVAVTSVIDNLVKGAAGGALQWMNRLFGWDETLGLERSAPAWS